MDNYIEEWIKQRSYFIAIMCSFSLYGWSQCSLQHSTECKTLYSMNCSLFIIYLCWDAYKVFYKKRTIQDKLVIHHIFSMIGVINNFSLQTSHVMLSLCMSLMEHILKNRYIPLIVYRSSCILFIRIPIATYFMLINNPNTVTFGITTNNTPYSICFIIYDIYTLYSLWKQAIPYIRDVIRITPLDITHFLFEKRPFLGVFISEK